MQTHYKNAVQIKEYGPGNYKITVLKNHNVGKKTDTQKKAEELNRELNPDNETEEDKHKKKQAQSISRTKKTVLEKALCNDWVWFVTLTLDPQKYARDDLDGFIHDLAQFIRDERKRTGKKISYLLIPELHNDLINWHMHGLLTELPTEDLEPHYMQHLRKQGYLNWQTYQKRFGMCSLSPIRDNVKCSLYITKYISKNFKSQKSVKTLYKKMYYCSQGLKKAEVIKQGILTKPLNFKMAFEGLYSKSTFIDCIDWFGEYFEEQELKELEEE